MELAVILVLLLAFLVFLKFFGWLFKAGIFVLSIPLQIIGAVAGVILLIFLLPFLITAGVLTVVFAPLVVFVPFLPLLLILFGLYLIARR